jgi:hypothetical protein
MNVVGLVFAIQCVSLVVGHVPSTPQVATTNYITFPLRGNYTQLFFWYASIAVGGDNYTVTVDTGSSDLLVPALGCSTCIGGDPSCECCVFHTCSHQLTCQIIAYYNTSGHLLPCSNTNLRCVCTPPTKAPCNFQVVYGGALTLSASGVHDAVSLGGVGGHGAFKSQNVLFGAIYNVTQPQQLLRQQLSRRSRHVSQQRFQSMQGSRIFV